MKKFLIAAALLALIVFAIPIEHKYDKLFRFYSITLIPQGLELTKAYDKKIYFYASDLIAITLALIGLLWFRIPFRRFFGNSLWIVFLCAFGSIAASPFIQYPVAYTRLIQLLTPLLLFSFLSSAFNDEQKKKIFKVMLYTFVFAALFQTTIAIVQYFTQAPLGLRLLSEPTSFADLEIKNGHRWIFDRLFNRTSNTNRVMRACGTLPHVNVLGGLLTVSLISTYALLLKAKRGKILLWLTLPVQFFAMCITYSRSALFGWALGSIIWFSLMAWKKEKVKWIAATMAFSIVITATLLQDQFTQRGGVVNYNQVAQSSDKGRLIHLNTAFQIIQKKPLFGLGFNQFSERSAAYLPLEVDESAKATAPHNIFLFLACETGLISLGAFLVFIVSLLWASLKTEKSVEVATLSSIFITFLFIGCCDFYPILFQQGKLMFFSITGLLAAYVYQQARQIPNPPRQEVWKMFDLISSTYDRTNRVVSLGMDQLWRKQVAKALPTREKLKVLDLATGTGDQILALLKSKASIQSVTGIDLSTEMVEIAKRKLKGQAEFLIADAENLPFPDESFDATTFSFGIRNVTDPLKSLQDIYRVLKPNGRCLILEFSLPPRPIRGFYLFYLRYILPKIGGLMSQNQAAYAYLNQTIEHFPSGKDFSSLMEKAGFNDLKRVSMSLGGVTLYIGEKH